MKLCKLTSDASTFLSDVSHVPAMCILAAAHVFAPGGSTSKRDYTSSSTQDYKQADSAHAAGMTSYTPCFESPHYSFLQGTCKSALRAPGEEAEKTGPPDTRLCAHAESTMGARGFAATPATSSKKTSLPQWSQVTKREGKEKSADSADSHKDKEQCVQKCGDNVKPFAMHDMPCCKHVSKPPQARASSRATTTGSSYTCLTRLALCAAR